MQKFIFPITLILLLFLTVMLSFLYIKTQFSDTSRHYEIINKFQELKFQDSMFNEAVIGVRYGLRLHDLPLSATLDNLTVQYNKLSELLNINIESYPKLHVKLLYLGNLISQKSVVVEKLLKNTRLFKENQKDYINTSLGLIRDIELTSIDKESLILLVQLMNYTISYNLDADPAIKQHAKNHINLLKYGYSHPEKKEFEKINQLIIESDKLLSEYDDFDQDFNEFYAIPVAYAIDEIENFYLLDHSKGEVIAGYYRFVLYLFSVVLLLYIFYTLFKLRHQRAVLIKANRENKRIQERMNLQVSALEAAGNGIMITDNNGTILWTNASFSRLSGYSKEEIVGKTPRILKSGEHNDKFYNNLWGAICSGRVWHGEIINRRKDGTQYFEEETITPVHNIAGDITHFIAIKQDVSERKRHENMLYRNNRALRVLSNTNQVLIRATNSQTLAADVCHILIDAGNYRFAWVGLAEYDQNKSIQAFAQAGFDHGYLESLNVSWADNESGQGPTGTSIRKGKFSVIKNILNDPKYMPWREAAARQGYASSIALPLRSGKDIWGALNIYAAEFDAFDDEEIALLQELADDLCFGMDNLETRAEHEKLQFQLQQAHKMEALGQLTGGIAHDFNNILASIMGYSRLALDRYVDDKESKLGQYLQEVYRAGERARDLISQMLAFTRGGQAEPIALDMTPLLKDVMKMLESTLPSSIKIRIVIDNTLPKILIDPVQLHQVIMNLCVNARDAMDNHGCLTVSLQNINIVDRKCNSCHKHFGGDFVELSVNDTGTGIKSEILERIFEPFFTTKEIGKGTGIGLSMVHGIIHKYNGHILIDSDKSVGTECNILFPVIPGESVAEPFVQHNVEQEAQRVDAHILIVDDDNSVAAFIAELFESHAYRVTVAHNGSQALQWFMMAPDKFDLVITDQTMPIMDGDLLARELLAVRPGLPIILCTGYSQNINEEKALEMGIKIYLEKPVDPGVLLKSAADLLSE